MNVDGMNEVRRRGGIRCRCGDVGCLEGRSVMMLIRLCVCSVQARSDVDVLVCV